MTLFAQLTKEEKDVLIVAVARLALDVEEGTVEPADDINETLTVETTNEILRDFLNAVKANYFAVEVPQEELADFWPSWDNRRNNKK